MKKHHYLLLAGLVLTFIGHTQIYSQYFDGADTSAQNSIFVHIDTSSSNIWQIGAPQKTIFNNAFSLPNVIVTDTIQPYHPNNISQFQFTVIPWDYWGVLAIQWTQKLDLATNGDGAIIDFSVDGGETWENVFNNPYVYNFYGFNEANVDTLQNGTIVFNGTDTLWRDLWLCYDLSWITYNDSIMVRYTLISGSIASDHEGWMIDNMLAHITIIHTVNEAEQEEYMMVNPNPTNGKIDIVTRKIDEYHIIEKMELINMEGRVMEEYGVCPTKFSINIGDHPPGMYILKIKTNIQTETFQIMLQK